MFSSAAPYQSEVRPYSKGLHQTLDEFVPGVLPIAHDRPSVSARVFFFRKRKEERGTRAAQNENHYYYAYRVYV